MQSCLPAGYWPGRRLPADRLSTLGESKWLLRASLPVNTYPSPPTGGHQTGLGDLNPPVGGEG
jgi:hypothetical protein